MKRKVILIVSLAFLMLGTDSCPTEVEEENTEEIGAPPEFPEVPPPVADGS